LKSKPRIKQLNLSTEIIAEIKRIIVEEPITQRRNRIREVLDGLNLCCCCNQIPSVLVTYAVGDKEQKLNRKETYCEKCYNDIYLNQIDLTLSQVAERYGCVKAEAEH